MLPASPAGTFRGTSWRLRAEQFTEIFKSRVSQTHRDPCLIPSEIEKEKLRRAEDLIVKKDAEIGSLRSSIAALKAKVEDLNQQVETSKRQEQVSFYAAEDAIKKLSEIEAANAKLSRQLAEHKVENTEAKMLKVLCVYVCACVRVCVCVCACACVCACIF